MNKENNRKLWGGPVKLILTAIIVIFMAPGAPASSLTDDETDLMLRAAACLLGERYEDDPESVQEIYLDEDSFSAYDLGTWAVRYIQDNARSLLGEDCYARMADDYYHAISEEQMNAILYRLVGWIPDWPDELTAEYDAIRYENGVYYVADGASQGNMRYTLSALCSENEEGYVVIEADLSCDSDAGTEDLGTYVLYYETNPAASDQYCLTEVIQIRDNYDYSDMDYSDDTWEDDWAEDEYDDFEDYGNASTEGFNMTQEEMIASLPSEARVLEETWSGTTNDRWLDIDSFSVDSSTTDEGINITQAYVELSDSAYQASEWITLYYGWEYEEKQWILEDYEIDSPYIQISAPENTDIIRSYADNKVNSLYSQGEFSYSYTDTEDNKAYLYYDIAGDWEYASFQGIVSICNTYSIYHDNVSPPFNVHWNFSWVPELEQDIESVSWHYDGDYYAKSYGENREVEFTLEQLEDGTAYIDAYVTYKSLFLDYESAFHGYGENVQEQMTGNYDWRREHWNGPEISFQFVPTRTDGEESSEIFTVKIYPDHMEMTSTYDSYVFTVERLQTEE